MPFRNEPAEIIDRDAFLQTYETNKELIMQRRKEFESNLDIEGLMNMVETLSAIEEEETIATEEEPQVVTNDQFLSPNDDDFHEFVYPASMSIVKRRSNVMSKGKYCVLMRKTNPEQRELILEVIHRLHERDRKPIQIFLTGPAGCGKTSTLKVLMETYNRSVHSRTQLYQ